MPQVVLPLIVRDLVAADLPNCKWAGSDVHLRNVASQLQRASAGDVDYLAACPPSGIPVAIGGIDYTKAPGAGQLAGSFQSIRRFSPAALARFSSTSRNSESSPASCTGLS